MTQLCGRLGLADARGLAYKWGMEDVQGCVGIPRDLGGPVSVIFLLFPFNPLFLLFVESEGLL
jgi:hypothetical protein